MVSKLFLSNFPYKTWKKFKVPCDMIVGFGMEDMPDGIVRAETEYLYTMGMKRIWGSTCVLCKGSLYKGQI